MKSPDSVMYLVRHGATAANESGQLQGRGVDLPLSPLGQQQVAAAARALAALPVTAIYSSPLLRARETAAAIAAPHDLPVATVDELVEVNVGRWEGLHWDEIRRDDAAAYDRFMTQQGRCGYPDGESYDGVLTRVRGPLGELLDRHEGERFVVVAHSVVNRTYAADLLGLPASAAREISQNNGTINVVRRRRGEDRLVTLNAAAVA